MFTFIRQLKDTPSVVESVDVIGNQYQSCSFFMSTDRYPVGADLLEGEVGCIFLCIPFLASRKVSGEIFPVVRVCQEKEVL